MGLFNNILDQEYHIFAVYSNGIMGETNITLGELNAEHESGDPSEIAIRFKEDLPDIMQMHPTDSMVFKPCRDDSTAKGIIVRIK